MARFQVLSERQAAGPPYGNAGAEAHRYDGPPGLPDECALAGLSMGGGQALSIGLRHLDLFHTVGAFSAGIRNANFEEQYKDMLADPAATNKKLKLFYIACGKATAVRGVGRGLRMAQLAKLSG